MCLDRLYVVRFSAIAIANMLLVAIRVGVLVGVLATPEPLIVGKEDKGKEGPMILAIRPYS